MVVPSTFPPPPPPVSPYGSFTGTLFQYARNLVAFESFSPHSVGNQNNEACHPPKKKCILLGGLSDGLIPTPYTKKLETACHDLGWSLVQPVLSSSYLGFGHGSLERDTEEIKYGYREIVLSGFFFARVECGYIINHTHTTFIFQFHNFQWSFVVFDLSSICRILSLGRTFHGVSKFDSFFEGISLYICIDSRSY